MESTCIFLEAATQGNSSTECFPVGVINKSMAWSNSKTHQIMLKNLTPNNTYTFKILGATTLTGTFRGVQIWTTEDNRDTVFTAKNSCDMAVLKNLSANEEGILTINVKSIDDALPYSRINAIEIIEYTGRLNNTVNLLNTREFAISPNPAGNLLYIWGDITPSLVSIYCLDGRKVKTVINTSEVNVSDLKTGVYIAVINTNGSIKTNKIIKE